MNSQDNAQIENEVLFQKLGNTWFAFTEINDELIYSPLPTGLDPRTTKLELYDIIEEHLNKVSEARKPEVAA